MRKTLLKKYETFFHTKVTKASNCTNLGYLRVCYKRHKKIKDSTKDFCSKYDHFPNFLQIWSHLLKKFLMESFIFVQRCVWLSTMIFPNIFIDFNVDFFVVFFLQTVSIDFVYQFVFFKCWMYSIYSQGFEYE